MLALCAQQGRFANRKEQAAPSEHWKHETGRKERRLLHGKQSLLAADIEKRKMIQGSANQVASGPQLTLSADADAPALFPPLLASPVLAAGAEAATAVASSADMESVVVLAGKVSNSATCTKRTVRV